MGAQVDDISKVQRLQLEIVKLVTERRVVVDVLHHRAQGGKIARHSSIDSTGGGNLSNGWCRDTISPSQNLSSWGD